MPQIGVYIVVNQICVLNLFNRFNFVLFASDADFSV